MKIPSFYEYRWKDMICRKAYKNLDYIREEYEIWSLWIDKFYNGKYGIYNAVLGFAPRYVLEYELDFCLWEKTYKKNSVKKNHIANHKVRSKYIIDMLKDLFNKVEKYDEKENHNIDFEEMKEKMMKDQTYKQRWFKAAYEANNYIEKLLTLKSNKKSVKKSNKRSLKKSSKKSLKK